MGYHKKVTLLQRAFKASARLRGTITQSIFMPSLWQIETAILGDLMALPRKVLQATLDQHCFVWDLSARLEEVQELSGIRKMWQSSELSKSHSSRFSLARKECLAIRRVCDDFGHCKQRRGTVGLSFRKNSISQKIMHEVNLHRVPREQRLAILALMYRNNLDRWWVRYREYKTECSRLAEMWQQWRISILPWGPQNRALWPPHPPIPQYPHDLTRVDPKWLETAVLTALRDSGRAALAEKYRRRR